MIKIEVICDCCKNETIEVEKNNDIELFLERSGWEFSLSKKDFIYCPDCFSKITSATY